VDVFCERGAFDLEQSRRILSAASSLGFPLKIHADEFANLGGAALAAELGAASADHLVKTSAEDIRALRAKRLPWRACTLWPGRAGLYLARHSPGRRAAGALASDAWCENMQFVIALACRAMRSPRQRLRRDDAAAACPGSPSRVAEPGKQADLIVLSVRTTAIWPVSAVTWVRSVIKKARW
jgi:imidazolonepropionase